MMIIIKYHDQNFNPFTFDDIIIFPSLEFVFVEISRDINV